MSEQPHTPPTNTSADAVTEPPVSPPGETEPPATGKLVGGKLVGDKLVGDKLVGEGADQDKPREPIRFQFNLYRLLVWMTFVALFCGALRYWLIYHNRLTAIIAFVFFCLAAETPHSWCVKRIRQQYGAAAGTGADMVGGLLMAIVFLVFRLYSGR